MRKKNWAALLCSILILASIGLGVSIIYSDYYFSPVSGLQSFTVADVSRTYLHPEEDAGTPSAAPSDELYALLERWALENEATILYKNGFAAGCGILDGSNWLREAVGLSLPCDAQGVLTAEDAAFSETYVRDGRFLPDALGLPVLGTYREQDVPSVISNAGFLYPLSMSGAKDGMYFTDGADTSGLTALFESRGYTVTDQRQHLSLPALAAKLLTDSVLSRAISVAMLGLIFCFSYVVLTMYRENDRRYQIYHLFGLSKARLFLRSTLTAMGIALTAALLFGVALYRGLTYMPDSDLTTLLIGTNLIDLYMSNLINKDEFTATRASCDAEIEELQSIIESVDKQREMIEQQQQLLKEIEDAIKEIVSGVEYEDEFYKHILDKMVVQDKDNIDVYLNLLPMKWSYTVAKASKKAVASEWNISEASLPMSVSRAFSSG